MPTTEETAQASTLSSANSWKERLRGNLRQIEDKLPGTVSGLSSVVGAPLISYSMGWLSGYGVDKLQALFKKLPPSALRMTRNPIVLGVSLSSYVCSLIAINNSYYRFISAPVGAVKEVSFSQDYLCWSAALRCGDASYSQGLCFGVTAAWAQHELTGKSLITNLRSPWIDKALLEKITSLYHLNRGMQGEHVAVPYHVDNTRHFEPGLELVTKKAVAAAVANPGQLYGVFFTDEQHKSAHVIGVLASQEHNKQIIKYFDSANREATFHDPNDAQKSLALAVRYGGYGSLFRVSAPVKVGKLTEEDVAQLPVAFVGKY